MVLEVTGTGNDIIADWYWISYEWKEVSGTTKDRFSGVAYDSEAKAKEAFETLKSDLTGNYNSFKKYLDDSKHPLKDKELDAPWPIKKTFYFGSKSRLFASIKISSTSQKSYYDFIDDAAGNEIAGYIMEAAEGEAGGKKYIVNEQGEKILLVSAYADDASFNTALAAMNANPEYSEKGVQKVGEELFEVWNTYEFSKGGKNKIIDYTLVSVTLDADGKITELKDSTGHVLSADEIKKVKKNQGDENMPDKDLAAKLGLDQKKSVMQFDVTFRYPYTQYTWKWWYWTLREGNVYHYDDSSETGSEAVTLYVDIENKKIWFKSSKRLETAYSGGDQDGQKKYDTSVRYYYLSGSAGNWAWKYAANESGIGTLNQDDILARNSYVVSSHALEIIRTGNDQTMPKSPASREVFIKSYNHVSTKYTLAKEISHDENYNDTFVVNYKTQTIAANGGDAVTGTDTELKNRVSSCVSGGYVLEKKTFYYSMERVLGSVVADDTGKMLTFYDRNGTVICAFSYQDESAYATDKEKLIKKLKELNYSENGNEYKPPYSCAIVLDASAENEVYEISVKDKTHDETLFTKVYASQEEYLEAFGSMGFMTEEVEGAVVTYTCQVNEYLLTITIDYSALEFHANIVNGDGEEVYVLNYDKG